MADFNRAISPRAGHRPIAVTAGGAARIRSGLGAGPSRLCLTRGCANCGYDSRRKDADRGGGRETQLSEVSEVVDDFVGPFPCHKGRRRGHDAGRALDEARRTRAMVDTGRAQEGAGGVTSVARPAEPCGVRAASGEREPLRRVRRASQLAATWGSVGLGCHPGAAIDLPSPDRPVSGDAARNLHLVAGVPEVEVIEHLRDWFDRNAAALRERGFEVSLGRGAPEADKGSMWIDIDSAATLGQLILWESGELDLRAGDRDSDELRLNEHREIGTADELQDALRDLLAAI